MPDPNIQDPRDAIIKVTACAICGSDLHLFNGVVPEMHSGDILGLETMGEVVEVGSAHKTLNVGDRVVVPFTISCGECFFCQRGHYSACERSNPDAAKVAELWGHSPAGLFGYSHLLGGYPGGQAEYLRVPFADVGPIKVPSHLTDEQVLFLSDIFPTGYMTAEFCNIQPEDTIASGVAVPLASLPSGVPSFSAPKPSLQLIPFQSGWLWRAPRGPQRWISLAKISTSAFNT